MQYPFADKELLITLEKSKEHRNGFLVHEIEVLTEHQLWPTSASTGICYMVEAEHKPRSILT